MLTVVIEPSEVNNWTCFSPPQTSLHDPFPSLPFLHTSSSSRGQSARLDGAVSSVAHQRQGHPRLEVGSKVLRSRRLGDRGRGESPSDSPTNLGRSGRLRLHSSRLRWTRESARIEVNYSRTEQGTQTNTSITSIQVRRFRELESLSRHFAMSSTVESTVSVPLTPMTFACSAQNPCRISLSRRPP